ncbi:MAG: hypothetical protein ISS45_06275 [Candidatus Omnitrophica bacterium]|nr:hypothetical protein [Candidatus Omnitrophota bacterium]
MKKILIFLFVIFTFSSYLYAQEGPNRDVEVKELKEGIKQLQSQFEQMKAYYDEKMNKLQAKIEQLEEEKVLAETKPYEATQAPQTSLGRYFQSFNPDVSVIGDFTFHGTDNKDDSQYNQFKMRQTELAFSASVDPYAKADFFMHIEPSGSEWKIGLCEGYLTLLDLPLDLQAKVGKFKANFGKVNRLHLHSLPWVDYPNMLTNFFGEEGMSEPGVSVSGLIPNPWDQYIELTFEALNNRNSTSFAGSEGRDMVYLAHLKNFFEINDESTVELGGSIATGPNDDGHGKNRTNLQGIDLTYKWRPLKEGLYKSLTFQNEVLFSQKDQSDGSQTDSWGTYSSLEYQFAKRWSAFGRYDFSEFSDYSNRQDNAISTGLTFAQSEYCFWRVHFKHTDRDYDKDSDEVWLQCNFGLGPHRAHEY